MPQNSLKSPNDVACLLIVYMRFHSALEIVELLRTFGVQRLYIAIDVAPESKKSSEYLEKLKDFQNSLEDFMKDEELAIYLWERQKNFGCAISVVTACDWFFSFESNGFILEDDCLPTHDFINFAIRLSETLNYYPKIMMICGTQHAIVENRSACDWMLSHYPFLWGWYTTRDKWLRLRKYIAEPTRKLKYRNIGFVERIYWRSGSRRAIRRFVDVWDTPMVANMVQNEELAILPTKNLVKNVGNDEYATNFANKKDPKHRWEITLESSSPFSQIQSIDDSIRNNFFRLRGYFVFRNLLRQILDVFKSKTITIDRALLLPDHKTPQFRKLS